MPCSFLTLFILFIFAIELNELETINVSEMLFLTYALGFALEKFAAMQEHGITGLSAYIDCNPVYNAQYRLSLFQGHLGSFGLIKSLTNLLIFRFARTVST